jgi:NhaA family Na+:H+ antiporter
MKRQISPLREFLHKESSSGTLLILAAALGLIVANSPISDRYVDLLAMSFEVNAGFFLLSMTTLKVINYGLMTIFFFVVGLEIKRELVSGHLSSLKKAAMPFIAAIGGMALPAGIYLAIAGREAPEGWAVPVATDIALAVGLLAMMGPVVTLSLRSFLLALAVIDDIGAILIIALVYSTGIAYSWLLAGVISIVVLIALKRTGVTSIYVYILCGLMLWYCLYRTGVHPTLAGVILGLLTPHIEKPDADFEDIDDGSVSYIEYLEAKLHPFSTFVVVPVFAFANTGVVLTSNSLSQAMTSVIAWGIFIGLVIGKPLGIVLAAKASSRSGIATLPEGAPLSKLIATGSAAGIGFTVAIFIADLAFDDPALQNIAIVAVIAGSLVSALLSWILFRAFRSNPTPTAHQSDPQGR